MRKAITIGVIAVMILVGFVVMANPIAANGPTIVKTMKVDTCGCDKGAWLGDTIFIEINVYNVPAGGGTVCDEIHEWLSYIPFTYMVNGEPEKPCFKDGMLIQKVGPGDTMIKFKLIYDSAPAETTMIVNTATLYYGDCDSVSDDDYIYAKAYCGFHKYFELAEDPENPGYIWGDDGDGIIEVGEDIHWNFWITIANINNGYIMYDVVIKDRFGAELEYHPPIITTQGPAEITYKKGKSAQMTLTWEVGDLVDGQSERLDMVISPGLNPSGKQSYTSPGCYLFNSGAVLKFRNPDGVQLSAHTPQLRLTVYEQDGNP